MGDTLIRPESTLADLAGHWVGASRVFQRHDLDFCCQGSRTLAEACRERRLAVDTVLAELRAEAREVQPHEEWAGRPMAQLIVHLVDHFHASHRAELPRLLAMSEKVENVHARHPQCPHGLAAHLRTMGEDLEQHMQKEEQVLFPLLLAGGNLGAYAPIQCLTGEHDQHALALAATRRATREFTVPADACTTWRALYLGLQEFERAVMEHVHLENHVLFPGVLRAAAAQGCDSQQH